MQSLRTPIVNLNGTSGRVLAAERLDIARKIEVAIEAMCAAMPHGRNYQTEPDHREVTNAAREAWSERIMMLRNLRGEMYAEAEAIIAQLPERHQLG